MYHKMALKGACEKEITQSRETFVQFGDRSHCFLLPQQMVIFMSTSQTWTSNVSPFGVMSRPQGCSQQCFNLWHYTVQNTDVCGNVLLLQSISGTEGGGKPGSDSGACLGNPLFITRMCHWWYSGCPLCSTVPDTQPGLHPGAQKRGWRGLTSSAAFPSAWLCPPCQVLVPWELTSLLISFVAIQFWRLFPSVILVTPDDAVVAAWVVARDPGWDSVCKVAPQPCHLETCPEPWGAGCCFCAGYRIPSLQDMPLPGTSEGAEVCSVGGDVLHTQAVCKQSIPVCLVQQGCASSCLSSKRQGCF